MQLPINAATPGVIRVIRCPKVMQGHVAFDGITKGIISIFRWGGVCYFMRNGKMWAQVVVFRSEHGPIYGGLPASLRGHVVEYEDGNFSSANRCALYLLEEPFDGPWTGEEE